MFKQTSISLLGALLLCTHATNAQQRVKPTEAQKKAAYEELKKSTPEERRARYLKSYKRKPELPQTPSTPVEKPKATPAKSSGSTMKTTGSLVPADAKFPGEFEEMQGVFISWPYDGFTTFVVDTLAGSAAAKIYFQLAHDIQQAGVKAYINVWYDEDTAAVKTAMANNGTPLTNYKFLVAEGDAFWARDFGPVNYYYDSDDKIGWLDLHYYEGRDYDNDLPIHWGAALGIPVKTSSLYQEGGNLLQDGSQTLMSTKATYWQNSVYRGYSDARTDDSLKSNLNLTRLEMLPELQYDGGTGHIDLYLDMTDENTIVNTKMPVAMASVPGYVDYAIANNNVDTLAKRNSFFNKPYKFFNIPLPTRDDGTWYTSASNYQDYTRTYTNHLIINKTIIQPIFSDALSGNAAGDVAAITAIKKAYPGYKILPIDMRFFDGFGGSIHCITKELAADNPLRFFHYAYRQLEAYQSSYPIDAIITNKSGIASATLYWRLKGATTYKSVPMTAASGNHWLSSIPAKLTAATDIFEYYISATSVNGKTITRPMTGADGPYEFWYNTAAGISEITTDGISFGNLYPNPTTDVVNMEVIVTKPMDLKLEIMDMGGRIVAAQHFGTVGSTRYLSMNTQQLASGIFMINVISDGTKIASRKLIKK